MLRVLYHSKGTALSVQEREIEPRTLDITRISGIETSEEGGAVWSAFIELVSQGWIKKGETTVLFMTGKQRCPIEDNFSSIFWFDVNVCLYGPPGL